MLIPLPLFKSLMVVVFGGVGVALLVAAFQHATPSLRSGLLIGVYWLAIKGRGVFMLQVLLPHPQQPMIPRLVNRPSEAC